MISKAFYAGYAEGFLTGNGDGPFWQTGRNEATADGFVAYLETLDHGDIEQMSHDDLWWAYNGYLEIRYRNAYREAWQGYVANAYEPDSKEWAEKLSWDDIRAAAIHWAESEWENYL